MHQSERYFSDQYHDVQGRYVTITLRNHSGALYLFILWFASRRFYSVALFFLTGCVWATSSTLRFIWQCSYLIVWNKGSQTNAYTKRCRERDHRVDIYSSDTVSRKFASQKLTLEMVSQSIQGHATLTYSWADMSLTWNTQTHTRK